MKLNKIILVAGTFFIAIIGCKKADEFPVEPVITFKSLSTTKNANGFDTKAHVTISFTDGDGDIGYFPSGNGSPFDDTTSQYYYNFIVKFFQKNNGVWVFDSTNLSGRMPFLTPSGSNKALKGDITMDLFLPFPEANDTVKYNIFIYDRALHQSNTIESTELIINTQ